MTRTSPVRSPRSRSSQSVPTFTFTSPPIKGNAESGMTAGNPGQEGDSSEPCALLADGKSFAHSHALWFCDRKLPTAGFTAGEIWCLVGSATGGGYCQSQGNGPL